MMSHRDRPWRPSANEVERLLLQAARIEAPPGSKERALLVASSAISGSGGSATGAAAGKGAAASITKTGSLAMLKWVGVAGIVGVGAVTGAMSIRDASLGATASIGAISATLSPTTGARGIARSNQAEAVESSPRRGPPSLEDAPTSLQPPALTTAAAPAIARQVGEASRTTPAATRTVASAMGDHPGTSDAPGTAVPEPRASTVRSELAMLDAARGAMAAGAPHRALSILDAYSTRFPSGAMAPEAAVLRVEGLVKAGDRAAAKRLADAILANDPGSPYLERLESMLGTSKP
jgi:hypothetical protein